jgi:Fe-S cluster biogenesis protein NfuA
MDQKIVENVRNILKSQVDPVLEQHYGGAVLTGIENGVAMVRLTGACASCPSAQDTIESVVKDILLPQVPELNDVILDTSVSEDLIDMAKKILNKEI